MASTPMVAQPTVQDGDVSDDLVAFKLFGKTYFDLWLKAGRPPLEMRHGKLRVHVQLGKGDAAARTLLGETGYAGWEAAGKPVLEFDPHLEPVEGKVSHRNNIQRPAPREVTTPGIAIAAIICAFLTPILGLILGYAARTDVRSTSPYKNGDGLATAAIVIGWLWIIILAIYAISMAALVGSAVGTAVQ